MHLPVSPRGRSRQSVGFGMLGAAAFLALPLSSTSILAADEAALSGTVSDGDTTTTMSATWVGQATSFTGRGEDAYAVGYFVQDGEVIAGSSLLADEDASVSALDLDSTAEGEGFSAVIAHGEGTDLTLTGSIAATDDGDGSNASDFSGLGAAIIASNGATVNVDSMDIATEGFVRAAFVADEQADIIVTDSSVTALGADPLTDIYEGYENNADIAVMISPPWVLGIQGGVRAGNMLGQQPSLSVVDSEVTAGSWAVLSVDSSSRPQMTVVDSDLAILTEAEGGMSSGVLAYSDEYGSGYGTYLIGNADQDFYGVTFEGMTYAAIFAGGSASYASSNGAIDLLDGEGNVLDTVEGDGEPTVIDAVWGFMSHGNADLDVLDGTQANSEEAILLYKGGSTDITLDEAVLDSASGIILQMIDNDDATVGNVNGYFNTEFAEEAGWPSENGNVTEAGAVDTAAAGGSGAPPESFDPGEFPGEPPEGFEPGDRPEPPEGTDVDTVVGADGQPPSAGSAFDGGDQVTLTMTNSDYDGDLYNGTGYYGQAGVPLAVIIGEGAELTGAISLTETRHIDENGEQNTYFTIEEYYYLGHVENHNYRNETAEIAVIVDDGGIWEVTGECLLTSLTLGDGEIIGIDGRDVVLTVDGQETELVSGTYESEIVLSLA